jgi:hypothetical protein
LTSNGERERRKEDVSVPKPSSSRRIHSMNRADVHLMDYHTIGRQPTSSPIKQRQQQLTNSHKSPTKNYNNNNGYSANTKLTTTLKSSKPIDF